MADKYTLCIATPWGFTLDPCSIQIPAGMLFHPTKVGMQLGTAWWVDLPCAHWPYWELRP